MTAAILPPLPKRATGWKASSATFPPCIKGRSVRRSSSISAPYSATPEGAKRFYPSVAQFLKGENTLPSHRVAAAYELYVNGDFKAALQEVSAAQQCAENCPVPGEEKYERRLLARIRADMDAARSAGHTE